jgi:hypothetical protein
MCTCVSGGQSGPRALPALARGAHVLRCHAHRSRTLVSLNWSPPKLLTQGLMPPAPRAMRYMNAQNAERVALMPAGGGGTPPRMGRSAGMRLTSVMPSMPCVWYMQERCVRQLVSCIVMRFLQGTGINAELIVLLCFGSGMLLSCSQEGRQRRTPG